MYYSQSKHNQLAFLTSAIGDLNKVKACATPPLTPEGDPNGWSTAYGLTLSSTSS